jgi:hypothetical protein
VRQAARNRMLRTLPIVALCILALLARKTGMPKVGI